MTRQKRARNATVQTSSRWSRGSRWGSGFLANFTLLMAMWLWVGGIVGFIAQMAQLRIAIWTVNISKGIFSFWHEFKAEKATEALRKLLPSCAHALRDGERERVLTEELVPGDVVLLEEGDRISADARLVDQNDLRVDESALTGQSHPVRKTSEAILKEDVNRTQLPNLTYAGTTVAAGTGRERVFATGMATEFGTIAHLTKTVGEELSPLQKEMKRVTKTISLLAISNGAFFFILGVLLVGTDPAQSFIFAEGTSWPSFLNACCRRLRCHWRWVSNAWHTSTP